MTCQWCVHYRRRKGVSLCLSPYKAGADGFSYAGKDACEQFDPRRTCTTCDHRCPKDAKDRLFSEVGGCPEWALRSLSTWGGNRRKRRA